MADFFDEMRIKITLPEGQSFTVFMRPLKVKEISILNRITYLQEKNVDDEQAAMMLIKLVVDTTSHTSKEIPQIAIEGLIKNFIEFNFPKDKPVKKVKKKTETVGIIDCIDFLISIGHTYSDIMEYHIPQFNAFIETASIRLGHKKKPVTIKRPVSTEEALRQNGIMVKPRI